jgi:hypothetical protein
VVYATKHLWLYEAMKISELQSPRPLDLPAFYVLVPVTLWLAWQRRREAPAGLAVAAVFAALGIWVARVAFDFYLVAAPTLAAGVPELGRRYGLRVRTLLVACLGVVGVVPNLHRAATLRLGPAWDASALPVRAVRFIGENALSGAFFNPFGEGGYLELALPSVPAFQDGRTQAYPQGFFEEQVRAHRSAESLDHWLRERGVIWALTSTTDTALSGSHLIEAKGWALVYWDERNEVLAREDVPALTPLIRSSRFRFFHPLLTVPQEIPSSVAALGHADLLQYLDEVRRFLAYTPDNAYAELARCALSRRLGSPEAKAACTRARSLAGEDLPQGLVAQAELLKTEESSALK